MFFKHFYNILSLCIVCKQSMLWVKKTLCTSYLVYLHWQFYSQFLLSNESEFSLWMFTCVVYIYIYKFELIYWTDIILSYISSTTIFRPKFTTFPNKSSVIQFNCSSKRTFCFHFKDGFHNRKWFSECCCHDWSAPVIVCVSVWVK